MWHDVAFLIVVAVLGLPKVTALRAGQPLVPEHISGIPIIKHPQPKPFGTSACKSHLPQWVQEGKVKRLKGPVVHFHIPGPYHTAGNYLADLARDIGNMTSSDNNHWEADFENPQQKWSDKTWTGLEDAIPKDHHWNDLRCAANQTMIFSIAVRHPLNMFFHRLFACRAWNKTLQAGPRADERCSDSDDCKICQVGAGPMCRGDQSNALEDGLDQSNSLEDESCLWDNIILQSIVGPSQAGPLTRRHLELAKARVHHNFDLIFVIEHFAETLELATTRLGWSSDLLSDSSIARGHKAQELSVQHQLTSSRITHEQWQRVIKRNSLDIELYDYMRKLCFDMLRADGLPVPKNGSTAIPQWSANRVVFPGNFPGPTRGRQLKSSRSSWLDARTI